MNAPHRKRVRHYHEPGDIHELTFSCYRRKPLLTNDVWCRDLAEAIDRSCERHRFGLLAYVFMPEHVHLLVAPLETEPDIARLLSDIKRPSSLSVKRRLIASGSRLLEQLSVHQRPGVTTFRFWQEGPGYDRNLTEIDTIMLAINYIHENPVRRRLCRQAIDWKWSSARRLITDAAENAPPRLCRFDPDSQMISPLRSSTCGLESEEHC
ncbi:MAG: transposase [Planctomycetota bacterium]|nr:transposase [Planctomycetota bacterium]MDA1215113.1 transposase [Planctomycetota bacterium]